jgi:multiple sugar transport system ATP-binding protein
VLDAARTLGIEQLLKRKPRALSGGQRQRVAMGRAIVRHPAAFLMDEPLSNLDAKLRVQMRAEISRIQHDLGVTTIYVTHDQVEAMTMGDRVAVMRKGELQQVATPQELYDRPVNLFVAGFIGSPAMNLLEADVEGTGDDLTLALGSQRLKLGREAPRALAGYAGRRLIVGIRPEGLEDAAIDEHRDTQQALEAQVELREALGSEIVLHLRIDATPAQTEETRELAQDVGNERAVDGLKDGPHAALVARVDRRSEAREQSPVTLSVSPDSLHFFDADTSLGIYDS